MEVVARNRSSNNLTASVSSGLRSRHRRVKSESDKHRRKTRSSGRGGSSSTSGDAGDEGMELSDDEAEEQEADYQAVLESLRRASGVADVLPAEPPEPMTIPPLEMPSHAVRDSMLHSGSGFTNYRGLYNLALIALFVSTARIARENISKYGLLVRPSAIFEAFKTRGATLCFFLFLIINVFALAALAIERLAVCKAIGPGAARVLHLINQALIVLTPTVAIILYHPVPVLSGMVMIEAAIYLMKLVSYVAVNRHYRENGRKRGVYFMGARSPRPPMPGDETGSQEAFFPPDPKEAAEGNIAVVAPINFPQNLTIANLAYFLAAPTLCYELNFPRNKYIRWRFLLRRLVEVIFLSAVLAGISQQWIMPTVQNTFKDGNDVPLTELVDRTLKLSLPNNILWLTAFYLYFHSILNLMGELLRFGDRQFYRDWWNSTTITYFWKNWNIPVHKWAVRHVYRPLLENGYSKTTAQLTVFVISAVLHEMLVSVPLGMFRLWSFLAMLMQVPLAILTESKYLKNTQYGNVVVWTSLYFGQPAAVMVYVQAYLAQPSHSFL